MVHNEFIIEICSGLSLPLCTEQFILLVNNNYSLNNMESSDIKSNNTQAYPLFWTEKLIVLHALERFEDLSIFSTSVMKKFHCNFSTSILLS